MSLRIGPLPRNHAVQSRAFSGLLGVYDVGAKGAHRVMVDSDALAVLPADLPSSLCDDETGPHRTDNSLHGPRCSNRRVCVGRQGRCSVGQTCEMLSLTLIGQPQDSLAA